MPLMFTYSMDMSVALGVLIGLFVVCFWVLVRVLCCVLVRVLCVSLLMWYGSEHVHWHLPQHAALLHTPKSGPGSTRHLPPKVKFALPYTGRDTWPAR